MVRRQFREDAKETEVADREASLPGSPASARGWSPLIGMAFVIGSSTLIWSLILFGALEWLTR